MEKGVEDSANVKAELVAQRSEVDSKESEIRSDGKFDDNAEAALEATLYKGGDRSLEADDDGNTRLEEDGDSSTR